MISKTIVSSIPFVMVLVPIISALIILAFGKRIPKIRDWFTVATTGIVFALSIWMYAIFTGKGSAFNISYNVSKIVMGIGINFRVDALSLLVAIITSFVWMIATIYSLGYMDHDPKPNRFYFFLLLVLASNLGVVVAADLFTLFIFFEGLGFLAYPLVIHEETDDAIKAGTKYMLMTAVGGLVLLSGIFLLYNTTGSFSWVNTLSKIPHLTTIKTWIAVLMIIGFGVKAGMIPLHIWLPDAHPVAPSPASALLSGIMIKAGAYGIIRTMYMLYGVNLINRLGISKVMLIIAVTSMILGSLIALRQTEIKRLLAYSSVAQMGYILMGAALLTPKSITGASLHIFNHALMKGTLFLSAGAIIHITGLRNLDDLHLLGKRIPIVMVAITIAGASMIGIPGTAGFVSKWYLATGAIQAIKMNLISYNWGIFLVFALLVSSMLNLLYYGSIILKGWIGTPEPLIAGGSGITHSDHMSWQMLIPITIMAAAIIIFGLFPQFPYSIAKQIALMFFGVIK